MNSYKQVANGTIGVNYSKDKPTKPDYIGSITILEPLNPGTKYGISIWEKTRASDGQPFFSFDITELPPRDKPKYEAPKRFDDVVDDIPF